MKLLNSTPRNPLRQYPKTFRCRIIYVLMPTAAAAGLLIAYFSHSQRYDYNHYHHAIRQWASRMERDSVPGCRAETLMKDGVFLGGGKVAGEQLLVFRTDALGMADCPEAIWHTK